MIQTPHLPSPLGYRPEGRWAGRDILSVAEFERADLEELFAVARQMRQIVTSLGACDLLKGRVLANLFYEASTRTSSSFMAAMQRLGGQVIPITSVQYSSVIKGESLPDTVRTLECYADVIVLRHHEIGAAALAARYASCPIINAGDGAGEHPTQALLDLFTILEELGRLEGLRVTMLGDLRYGRTVHSLSRLLARYGASLRYVSPPSLRMPDALQAELAQAGVQQEEHDRLDAVLGDTDVLYVTRVQKERLEDPSLYEAVKDAYVISPQTLQRAQARMIVMHPLPRVGEITMEVDDDPRAVYFKQMRYGLYVRMALLAMVMGRA
jgi:aspartate carbamoyltransferase catalytic subunit